MDGTTPVWWHELDDRAQAAARQSSEMMGGSFRRLGVERARSTVASLPREVPLTPVHEVSRRQVSSGGVDVPIRVYRPRPAPVGTALRDPALLYIHGGGFTVGTLEGVDELCRALAVAARCVVVSVGYRLAPEFRFPIPLEDCVAAYKWLLGEAAGLGVDPRRIAVGGDSAGGNLAAALCLTLRDVGARLPVLQVLAYPAVDCTFKRSSWNRYADAPLLTTDDARWFWTQYVGSDLDATGPLAAPMRAASLSGLPRAHVATAAVDPTRDDAEAFARRMEREGGGATLIRYPGVFHGFFTEVGAFEQTRTAIDDAANALRLVFH